MEPTPSTPNLPPEIWAKIFSYVPPIDLIRSVLPVSRMFKDEAYRAMRDVDWFQDWGDWHHFNEEFLNAIHPPKTLSLGARVIEVFDDYQDQDRLDCRAEFDQLVKRFPDVSKLSFPWQYGSVGPETLARTAAELLQIGVEMRNLVEFHDEAPLYQTDDVVRTLLANPQLKSLSLSNRSSTDEPPPRLHAGVLPRHLSALQDLPHLNYLSVDCELLEPDSFQALNAYPALTQLKLKNLTHEKFSGLAQAMSDDLGRRLSLAHLSGELGEDMPAFLAKCPHLRDLAIGGGSAEIALSPLAQLKTFSYRPYRLEYPPFAYFLALETLDVTMMDLRRHTQSQLAEGLRRIKSLEIRDSSGPWAEVPPDGALSRELVVETIAGLSHLEHLSYAMIERPAIRALLTHPHWSALKQLGLYSEDLFWEELEDICQWCPSLNSLRMGLHSHHGTLKQTHGGKKSNTILDTFCC